jgi:hypothetical protein
MRVPRVSIVAVLAVLACRPLAAQLVGTPFRVSAYVTDQPDVAIDGQGRIISVSRVYQQNFNTLAAQRFSAAGAFLGAETIFADTFGAAVSYPKVAADGAGDFLVVWESADGAGTGIAGLRFSPAGAIAGSEFRVNTTTTGDQIHPRVAADPNGNFVVVWEAASAILAQRYTSSGATLGGEFRVDTGGGITPQVAANANGFVVVWRDPFLILGQSLPSGRRYSSSGSALGAPFLVNPSYEGYRPSVAFDAAGDFVVAWADNTSVCFVQRYSSSGSAQGSVEVVQAFNFTADVAGGTDGAFLVMSPKVSTNPSRGIFLSHLGTEIPPRFSFVPTDFNGSSLAGDGKGSFVAAGLSSSVSGGTVTVLQRIAQPPEAIGPERRVDATASVGVHPAVAEDADGNFVVVWTDAAQNVQGRRFDAAGAPIGSEFRVNSDPADSGTAYRPDVASLPGGGFVVTWEDYVSGVFARRFAGTGTPIGTDFRVNAVATSNQLLPVVASDATGGFVVAWAAPVGGLFTILAQRYSSVGAVLGQQLQVSTYTGAGTRTKPAVARDGPGNFVVTWEDSGQDGSGTGIYMRRYSNSGSPLTGELRVNTITAGSQRSPRIGMDPAGDFVIAYTSDVSDGSGSAVLAQGYSSEGAAQWEPFRVNTYSTGDQTAESVSMNAAGAFTIVWFGPGDDSSKGVFGQRYKKTGEPIGVEFRVNSYMTGDQQYPAVVFGPTFAVTWSGAGPQGNGVYERVFFNSCRGNLNGDAIVDVADVFFLINHLFANGPAPPCSGDVNGDQAVDVADVFSLINYLFAGGPPPI